MREINITANVEFIGGVDANAAAVFDNFDRFQDFQETALAAEAANTGLIQQLHEGLGRTVKNGNFDVVDIDKNVVDAAGIRGR
jgi:hypothetical protein